MTSKSRLASQDKFKPDHEDPATMELIWTKETEFWDLHRFRLPARAIFDRNLKHSLALLWHQNAVREALSGAQQHVPTMICLTLSTERVRNTVITNEQGQVLYKTNTPFRLLGAKTTTIQKIKPNDDRYRMHDQFEVLGEIEWHKFTSSKFRTGGTEVKTKRFIPEKGLLGVLLGRRRVFTGPDGRPYRWDLKTSVVVLSRDDGSRMEVARYHRATLGIIGKKRKAMLEVSPEVAHMMDTVIMTFIYVEQLRSNRHRKRHRW